MNSSVDELTVDYEEDGILKVKELNKEILTKGAWATVMFSYQEWNPDNATYGPEKYTIRRYRKSGGTYRQQSKFNISSKAQARQIVSTLELWLADNTGDDLPGEDD